VWSLAFLRRGAAPAGVMCSPASAPDPDQEIHEVVPARAVLTELARGFLLVREKDRERAVRFAMTFLRERAGPATPARPTYPVPPSAQGSLGRSPLGAVEKLDPRSPP
jgi:hypothetical protein